MKVLGKKAHGTKGKSEYKGRFPLPGNLVAHLLVIFVGKWSWVANGHGLLSLLMTKHGPEKIGVSTTWMSQEVSK